MSSLDADIEWHRKRVAELRRATVHRAAGGETDVLRQALDRYEATLAHLERLRGRVAARQS